MNSKVMRVNMYAAYLAFLYLAGQPTLALIGYDCETPSLNVTTIAIDEVAQCSREPSDYRVEMVKVQVVQREELRERFVRSCLIEVVRTIFHCGMFSHTAIVSRGTSSYIHPLGAVECREAHRQKSLTFFNHFINKLIINGTTTASVTMFGKLLADGECKGVVFNENERTWTDVIVVGALKITLNEGMAKLKLSSDEITVPGGIVCPFLAGYCTDSTYGETVWDVVTAVFCGEVATLYEGDAQRIVDLKRGMQYLVVQAEDRIFAFTIVSTSILCQRVGWQTEHPQILVFNTTGEITLGDKHAISSLNTDLLAYVNSKFLYVEQATRRNLETLHTDTVFRRCQMHREILKNRLLTAPLSPSAVGWIIKQQRGYIGRVLGEVLYLLKCTPRPAEIRRSSRCYNELPVSVNNESRFLAPSTHIILTHAEEVDCSPLTPPMFLINNRWIGLIPEPVLKDSPMILQPEKEEKIQFEPIQPLSSGGIYTNAEVTKSQRLLMFGAERKAVENVLIRKISGSQPDSQGFQTLKLFDTEDMKKLARTTMKQVWGWFTDFGLCVSGLMGVYVVFQLAKYVLGVAINSWQIYRTLGCGFAVIAAVWDTLTMWVIHRHPRRDPRSDVELQDMLPSAPPDPTLRSETQISVADHHQRAHNPQVHHWSAA